MQRSTGDSKAGSIEDNGMAEGWQERGGAEARHEGET